jgi:Tfp pilus assembly protein PilP
VGLLESGENSAALFDVDGVTQRFKIGESIGASGWTLVSVANQEAVVRRNGEVRSVYVGQKF